MRKILISTSSFDVNSNIKLFDELKQNGFELVFNPYGRRLTENEVSAFLKDGVVGIVAGLEPLNRRVIDAASNLKVISRCGIGMEYVDLQAAKEHCIEVYNTPSAPVNAVAELTIGLILSVLRRVAEADRNIRNGDWKPLMGNLLSEQTVGIVGYGRIGSKVAQLLRVFGTKIIACDIRVIPPHDGISFLTSNEVMSQADIVVLHLSFDTSTRHIIDNRTIAMMKKGAKLINTSRGELVDEDAVVDALKSGHLSGAGLDTFETEPYMGPLTSFPQVVLTSHMGSYAIEARAQMEKESVANLLKGLKKKGLMD